MRRFGIFALVAASWFLPDASALDSGHFKGMKDADLAPILDAFEGVPVYYLQPEKETAAIFTSIGRNPKIMIGAPLRYGVFMHFNPREAEQACREFEQKHHAKCTVRRGEANKYIREQFARRELPPSDDPHAPDYVLFVSWLKKIDTIDYIAKPDSSPMLSRSASGRPRIHAFLNRDMAIKVQGGMKEGGVTVMRVGLDEKTFVHFVVEEAQVGRQVHVEGFAES